MDCNNIYIYKIINTETNDVYLGIREVANDIKKDKYKGEDTSLSKYLRKYGKKSFKTEILAQRLNLELAKDLINKYKDIFNAVVLEDSLLSNSSAIKKGGQKRKVICLNNKKVFNSTADASVFYNLKRGTVSKACCNNGSAGRDPITGEKLKWMHYDKYLALQNGEEFIPKLKTGKGITKKVLCKTTNEEFNSVKEASLFYNVSINSIYGCCSDYSKCAGKHPKTNEPLEWAYLD